MDEYTDNCELEPVMRKVSAEREAKVFMMRRSQAQIERAITPAMKDAWFEIELAFRMIAGHMGYGAMDANRVKGHADLEEQEWKTALISKYREWARRCPSTWKGVVIDMTAFSFSVEEIGYQRNLSKKTVIAHFRQGLNEYCILQSWGDQINPQK